MINSVIIDDEAANLEVLDSMLKRHCPEVNVKGKAQSAAEGYRLIRELSPDLVFLDIKMPGASGFDLLRMFGRIEFNVIFVSGFDHYAIQAFEFSAVDYILKPIDHSKLVTAVDKAKDRIIKKNNDNIIHFIHSLDEKTELISSISLHQNDKVHIVELKDIYYIQAARGYSEIVTATQKFVSAKPLNDYEELLSRYPYFIRANKSMIININYIREYTKGAVCFISMKNCDFEIEIPRRKKTAIIRYLKDKG